MQLEEPPANGEQSSPLPATFFKIWEFGGELHNLLYTLEPEQVKKIRKFYFCSKPNLRASRAHYLSVLETYLGLG